MLASGGLDWDRNKRSRAGALAAAGAIHVVLIYLLMTGLGVDVSAKLDEAMQVIEIGPPPPPPVVKTIPPPKPSPRPSGKAAPPNLKSVATPIVAPPPVIRLPVPSPVVVAPVAGVGAEATAGSAEVPGPGTGGGGQGNGTGSGGDGDGDGGGADYVTPPRELMTKLRFSFYPQELRDELPGRRLEVRYRVGVDGRVTNCRVIRSSGNRDVDAATCPAIERNFRWRPPLDEDGRPVPLPVIQNHSWDPIDEPPSRD